jgi:tetratricopeptide (TPR) repeat protein
VAFFSRGLVRSRLDRHEQAIEDFNESLRLDPDHVQALVSRGQCRARLKDAERALADFNAALRLAPDDALTYYTRGMFHQERGSYRAAVADYERAIEMRPDDPHFRNQIAWLLATCSRPEIRNGPAAVEHATKGCTLTNWQEGNVIDTLAAAYAECGRFAEAVEYAQKAIALAPGQIREEIRGHVQLFQSGKPFRSEPPATEPSKLVPPWKRKKRR